MDGSEDAQPAIPSWSKRSRSLATQDPRLEGMLVVELVEQQVGQDEGAGGVRIGVPFDIELEVNHASTP